MRRYRIHLPSLEAGPAVVTGGEASHLVQVLRVAPGATVRAFDGQGREADGVVREAEPGRVVVDLAAPEVSASEAAIAVTVAVALLKGDKLAGVVRACTELGALRFRPFLSRRGDVPSLSANKLERLRRVAREAAKQSGRAVVPEVAEPSTLGSLEWSGEALVAHPGAGDTLATLSLPRGGHLTLLTGPEGGLAPEEIADLERRGARRLRLGDRVLRAETAPVALLAALLVPEAL